jgi:hypothetical protein
MEERLRRQGYKLIDEADLSPVQRAFAEGFKKGWNAACEHHEELRKSDRG